MSEKRFNIHSDDEMQKLKEHVETETRKEVGVELYGKETLALLKALITNSGLSAEEIQAKTQLTSSVYKNLMDRIDGKGGSLSLEDASSIDKIFEALIHELPVTPNTIRRWERFIADSGVDKEWADALLRKYAGRKFDKYIENIRQRLGFNSI